MSNHATYGIVYVVTNTVNGKQYVGQTTQALAKRWAGHTSRSNKQCRALWNAIQKYGAGAFTLATVDSGTDKDDLDAKETEWVSRLGTVSPAGYNLTTGGGSSGKPSPETIELRRMALLGHTTSQETRDLIRAAQVGRPLTHEHRDALKVPKRNRSAEGIQARKVAVQRAYANMTPEDRQKFGQHRVGTRHTEETLAKMRVSALARAARKREADVSA